MNITRKKFILFSSFSFLGFFIGIPSPLAKKTLSAKAIFELHKQTQVGIMDCKYTLAKSNGNLNKALTIMLKRGKEKYHEYITRKTPYGRVVSSISQNHQSGAIIEIECETDFAARTNIFIELSNEIAQIVREYSPKNLDELKHIKLRSGYVNDKIIFASLQLKENIRVTRLQHFEVCQ